MPILTMAGLYPRRRRNALKVPSTQYAVKVGDLQWVRIPSGHSIARPEAIRAMKDKAASIKTRQRVRLVSKGPVLRRAAILNNSWVCRHMPDVPRTREVS